MSIVPTREDRAYSRGVAEGYSQGLKEGKKSGANNHGKILNPDALHPGTILEQDFLIPYKLTQSILSKRIGMSQGFISDIIRGRRSVSAVLAHRLARFFNTTPDYWTSLQATYDLAIAEEKNHRALDKIEPYRVPGLIVGPYKCRIDKEALCLPVANNR